MAYSREIMPARFATGDQLTSDLVGIGFGLAAPRPPQEPNIEDTLVAASLEGLGQADYRVLALLLDWIEVHAGRINVDRLTRMVKLLESPAGRAFWSAVARWQAKDWRFRKLGRVYTKPRVDLLPEGNDFQISRHGEDERFKQTPLRVPANLLRRRPQDILAPPELARTHRGYSWRVAIGPSYRADIWALIERSPEMTPSELARRAYGSFPSAWEARRDWLILHPVDAAKGSRAASDAEATAALGRSRRKFGKALKDLG